MKEPSFSRRKRPNTTSKKLKLVCSFNGVFQPRPPLGKLRYVGGETRIVSVDRNIGLLKLRSKISELCPNTHSFSLKYQLPESDPTHGDDTTTPLILIVSDDDVWCMIDEYDKVESYGKRARLWIYVCSDNGYVKDYTDMSDIYVNCAKGVSRVGESLCSNVFGRPDCGSLLSGVKFDGKEGKVTAKNVARVRYGGEFSLRKIVLKQQLLAKQSARIRSEMEFTCCGEDKSYDHPLIDLASEPQIPMIHENTTQSFEDPYGVSMLNYGITNTHLSGNQNFSYSHPLSPRDGNLRLKKNSSMQCLSGQSGQVMGNGTAINGGNSSGSVTAAQFPKQLYKPSIIPMSMGANAKQDLRNTEPALLSNFNRENIVPWDADSNSLKTRLAPLSYSNQLFGSAHPLEFSYTGIRNHRFGISDTRNQRTCSHHTRNHHSNLPEIGNHRSVGLDGRPLVGRYHPGLRPTSNISKQGQSMRSYYPNSWKPWSNSQAHTMEGTVRMMDSSLNNQTSSFGLQYSKEYVREEQGGLPFSQYGKPNPKECQLSYQGVRSGMGDQSLLSNVIGTQEDLLTGANSEKCKVPYQDLYENFYGVPGICKPVCCEVKKEPLLMDLQEFVNISGFPDNPGYSNHHNGTHTLQDGIASPVDLSLYNLSLSSSKVEPPSLSSLASSDVSESFPKCKSQPLDILDEGQFFSGPQVELSNGVASNSSSPKAAKLGKDDLPKEEIQQDLPSNADTKERHNSSKVIAGISSGLAAFCTHLATRQLQTIKNSDLEYIKELGSGTYGTVLYGKWKGSDVAIKKIKPGCFTEGALEEDQLVADFWKEAQLLGQLHHPNIVAFYGVVTDGPVTNLATVTEYMVNGSLKQVLRKKDRTIDRRKRLIIARDAAFGMEYLHDKNIVHFDLKSHNFLVNMKDPQRPVCKIGDLGLSKIKQKTLVSGGVRGTIPWMAPELLNCKNKLVTEKIDVYSFGIVMWELLTGEVPYANLPSEEIIAGIIKGDLRPEIPSWCDPAWRSLMERCWSPDPDSRPAFSEIAKELRAMSAAMNIK